MKSVCLTGQQEVTVRHIPEPQICEADDVKIKVIYTAICADEAAVFSRFRGELPLGHEFSGIVTELGPEAKRNGFSVGDHVTGYTWRFCGKCVYCRKGKENLCLSLETTGAMQEYIVLKDRQLCKIALPLSLQEGCLFELTASCIHGLDCADIHMGTSVLILGGGGAGLVLTQLAKLSGAAPIVVSEPLAHKRQLCLKAGAHQVLNPYVDQLVPLGMSQTEGLGYDCIIDASRNEEAIHEAAPLLSRGGTLLLFCLYNTQSRINLSLPMMYNGELTVRTSYMAPYLQDRAMRIMTQLNLKLLLSKPFSIDEAQKAFETAYASKQPRVFIQISSEP